MIGSVPKPPARRRSGSSRRFKPRSWCRKTARVGPPVPVEVLHDDPIGPAGQPDRRGIRRSRRCRCSAGCAARLEAHRLESPDPAVISVEVSRPDVADDAGRKVNVTGAPKPPLPLPNGTNASTKPSSAMSSRPSLLRSRITPSCVPTPDGNERRQRRNCRSRCQAAPRRVRRWHRRHQVLEAVAVQIADEHVAGRTVGGEQHGPEKVTALHTPPWSRPRSSGLPRCRPASARLPPR